MRKPHSNNSSGARQREPGAEGEGEREGQGWRHWCEIRVEERGM